MEKKIVFLGATDNYPLTFSANNSKNELIAKGLIENNNQVVFINKPEGDLRIQTNHYYTENNEGIKYYIFPKRILNKLPLIMKNLIWTFRILKKERQEEIVNFVVLCHTRFPTSLFHFLFAKILKFKIIFLITEWHLSYENLNLLQKIDFYLYDRILAHYSNCIFPISSYIENKLARYNKPMLKVPILANYDGIDMINRTIKCDYFLYCGGLGYYNVIELIILSFNVLIKKKFCVKLYLVLNGTYGGTNNLKKIKNLVEKNQLTNNIVILQNIPKSKLYELYKKALALLIPMRPIDKDVARFPQKIGEYLSTGRPIITGEVGEVKIFFSHNVNAYIVKKYTIEAYSEIMIYVFEHRDQANEVGQEGYQLGKKVFNYHIYGKKISGFLDLLCRP